MKEMETKQSGQYSPSCLPILQKMDLLVKATTNFPSLMSAAEKSSVISNLEKDTILGHFGKLEDQFKVFYMLLSAKSCPTATLLSIFNSTGNERVASVLQHEEMASSDSNEETVEENEQWILLQKVITNNIDRLSSHTMNLGLVLCFASGIGLITGKDREIIANYSTLEIDQLKKFYLTVSSKENGYDKLIKVLKMTNNNWALNVLQID